MTIIERIKYLSRISMEFDFDNYLRSNNKQLIIFEIDTTNERYKLKEGEDIDNILEKSNEKYFCSKAGYLFNISNQLDTKINADIMLLSEIVLNSNPIDLDTIIIHELVHLLIYSDRASQVKISEEAEILGNKISRSIPYDCVLHDNEFCNTLAQACINYNKITFNFETPYKALRSAMRFDIYE